MMHQEGIFSRLFCWKSSGEERVKQAINYIILAIVSTDLRHSLNDEGKVLYILTNIGQPNSPTDFGRRKEKWEIGFGFSLGPRGVF